MSGIILERLMTPPRLTSTLTVPENQQARKPTAVPSQTYEITFRGQAGSATRAAFDDCQVSTGPGTTTLRAELPDQAALAGLVQRVTDLRLELILVQLVAPPPVP